MAAEARALVAIQLDCFVATLLAMTNHIESRRNYCNFTGYVRCNNFSGTGITQMFIARPSSESMAD